MTRKHIILVVGAAVLIAVVAGLVTGHVGAIAVIGLVGAAVAIGAFIDLRLTLLAIVPAMVLLPELPLGLPLRTEDLLMVPLAGAWLGQIAMNWRDWPSTRLNAPIFAIVGVELLSTLWGGFSETTGLGPQLYSASFFLLKTIEVMFLFFITISAVRTERDVRLFTFVLCASAVVLGLWGMIEQQALGSAQAFTGPAGHRGYSLVGLSFVVLLAVIVSLMLTARNTMARAVLAVGAVPVAVALAYTFSRQSYVGAVAAVAVLAWVRDKRFLIPLAAVAAVVPFLAPAVVQERALSIVTGVDPTFGTNPYATRLHALELRLPEVMSESPLIGFGLAALPPGFLDNQYLLTLYYTGIIGLGVFLWLLWRSFRTALGTYRSLSGDFRGLPLAWLAATVGLCIAGVAGSPFVAVRVRQIYWFLAALALAAARAVRDVQRDPATASEEAIA